MLLVHILEDEEEQRISIKKKVKKIIQKNNYDMELGFVSGNPEEFLEKTKEYPQSVYLLDIVLHTELTGLDVAEKIRNNHSQHDFLIIITSEIDFMQLALQLNIEVLNFILKRNKESIDLQLEQSFEMVQRRINSNGEEKESLYLKYKGVMIQYDKILYIQIVPEEKNKIEIVDLHLEKYIKKGSIKELKNENKLDGRFYSISRSAIVNLKYAEFDEINSEVIMNHECRLNVSFRNRSGLRRKIINSKNNF